MRPSGWPWPRRSRLPSITPGGGSCSPLALAAEPAAPEAAAAEPAGPQAEGSEAGGARDGDGERPLVTIETGAAKRVEGQADAWSFPDLTMESSDPSALIRSITIQFTSAITVGADAVLVESDSPNGFEVLPASKDGTAVVNNAEGATAAQWQAYLREHSGLRLGDGTAAKSLRMVASFKTQDTHLRLQRRERPLLRGSYGGRHLGAGACRGFPQDIPRYAGLPVHYHQPE